MEIPSVYLGGGIERRQWARLTRGNRQPRQTGNVVEIENVMDAASETEKFGGESMAAPDMEPNGGNYGSGVLVFRWINAPCPSAVADY